MLELNASGEVVDSTLPPRAQLHPRLVAAKKILEAYNPRFDEAKQTATQEDDDSVFEEMVSELNRIW